MQHAFSQERITALLEDRKQREDAAASQAAETSSKLEVSALLWYKGRLRLY